MSSNETMSSIGHKAILLGFHFLLNFMMLELKEQEPRLSLVSPCALTGLGSLGVSFFFFF